MKKAFLSAFVIIMFVAYAIRLRIIDPIGSGINLLPNQDSGQAGSNTPTPNTGSSGGYRNGQYTGDVADAYYGNVQVKAVISGGKITDVQFLDFPQDRRTSIAINTQAIPYLKSEAIQAQSAQVDGVSGATQTSRAFRESLQSALDQAVN